MCRRMGVSKRPGVRMCNGIALVRGKIWRRGDPKDLVGWNIVLVT